MSYFNQEELISTLISRNLLSSRLADLLWKKAQTAGQTPEAVLLSEKMIDEEKLLAVKASLFKVPPADLRHKKINEKILNLIPLELAIHYQLVAFAKNGSVYSVALADPNNHKAIELLQYLTSQRGLEFKIFVASQSSINAALKQYGINKDSELLNGLVKVGYEARNIDSEIKPIEKNAPLTDVSVSKLVLVILHHALEGRSSDIHIEPTHTEIKVRYRIDGLLRTSLVLPKYMLGPLVHKFKTLSNLDSVDNSKPQTGRFRLEVGQSNMDFRISVMPLVDGEKIVLKPLDRIQQLPKLSELGFLPEQINLMNGALMGSGLIVLAGPSGSGKRLTLYSLLEQLNSDGVNIITLEDPVEHYLNGINQSAVNSGDGYGLEQALLAAVNQDPDVIMLEGINDPAVAQLAVSSGLGGQLILTKIYTKDSMSVIERLKNLGVNYFSIASSLKLIIAQRMVKKICLECIAPVELTHSLTAEVKKRLKKIPKRYLAGINLDRLSLSQGNGCAYCGGTGYKGQQVVAEVVKIDQVLKEAIASGAKTPDLDKILAKQDFLNLSQVALIQALKGVTTLQEVLRQKDN